jgi:hypothetical protein
MRRVLSAILLCALLIGCFSGCAVIEKLKGCCLEHDPTEAPSDPLDGKTQLTAELFIQSVAISSMYSLDIEVVGDMIRVNNTLYKKAGRVTDPEITYEQSLFWWAEHQDPSGHITEVLEKIQDSESCYVLEAENYASTGMRVVIYEIDGMYYFATSLDGIVLKIHAAPIEK